MWTGLASKIDEQEMINGVADRNYLEHHKHHQAQGTPLMPNNYYFTST